MFHNNKTKLPKLVEKLVYANANEDTTTFLVPISTLNGILLDNVSSTPFSSTSNATLTMFKGTSSV